VTRLRLLAALVALSLLGGLSSTPTARAAGGGYGDWSCRPTADRPDPVVLLHGLGGDPERNFAYLGPALAAEGWCVFASPYSPPEELPFYGLAAIDDAAADVAGFVQEVLTATDAERVALVGHSEGGFLSLYAPKFAGIADRVRTVVALAPPTHGVTFFELVPLGRSLGFMDEADTFLRENGCPACADLVAGGPAVQRLEDGPIAQPGIDYTVIATRTDLLVQNSAYSPPTDTAFVRELGVTNLYVQDRCPADLVGHVGLAFDPTVLGLVQEALDDDALGATCSVGLPI
jgi:pimeloyl-ACP methyl ester carboxylesterase